jgi:hypothetical protein
MKNFIFNKEVLPSKLRAIKEYGKFVTRRTQGLDEINKEPDAWGDSIQAVRDCHPVKTGDFMLQRFPDSIECIVVRPRYSVGERVFIREPFRIGAWDEEGGRIAFDYKFDNFSRKEWINYPSDKDTTGDGFEKLWIECSDDAYDAGLKTDEDGKYHWKPGESPCRWRSPYAMKEEYARYFGTVASVRLERLQEITNPHDEILKEGYPWNYDINELNESPVKTFAMLWDSTVKPPLMWENNPYVFRYEVEVK